MTFRIENRSIVPRTMFHGARTFQLNLSDQIKFSRAEHVTHVPNELHRTAGALQSTAGQRQRAAKKVRNQLLDHRVLGQPKYIFQDLPPYWPCQELKRNQLRVKIINIITMFFIIALLHKQIVGKDNTLPKRSVCLLPAASARSTFFQLILTNSFKKISLPITCC